MSESKGLSVNAQRILEDHTYSKESQGNTRIAKTGEPTAVFAVLLGILATSVRGN